MRRRFLHLVSITALLGAFIVVGQIAAAPEASATASCSGRITWASSLKKEPRAQLVIYYNSSNGGTNSACMRHAGSTYGKAMHTEVEISRCEPGYDESDNYCFTDKTSRTDKGNFKYYAGPVGVTGTKSRCVTAWGTMEKGNTFIRIDSDAEGC
jgi:hypothetical protein